MATYLPTYNQSKASQPCDPPIQAFDSVKTTSPVLAPPAQVPDMEPVGHTAWAARTHCSQRLLEMLMVAPDVAASRVNLAVPDWPVVETGLPPHFWIEPAIPPQMLSSATFWSWDTMWLGARRDRSACAGDGSRLVKEGGGQKRGRTRWRRCTSC